MRLRLLNVCSARVALIAFVGLTPAVIAIDGQPSELFQTAAGMIPIGPGSRFEVMVDLPADGGKQASLMLRGGAAPDQALVRFETKGKALPSHGPIAKLPDNPLLPERIHLERSLRFKIEIDDAAVAATVADPAMVKPTNSRNAKDLPLQNLPLKDAAVAPNAAEPSGRWTVNGVAKGEAWGKPLFKVRRGMPVNLTFLNKSVVVQQMHVHGHVMRVLHDLDDGWDPYWRDSLLLASGQRKLVAFVADNPGKWVIESLILDRQVSGLAAWFEVT